MLRLFLHRRFRHLLTRFLLPGLILIRQSLRPRHKLEIFIFQISYNANPVLDIILLLALDVHDARDAAGAEKDETVVSAGGAFEVGDLFTGGYVVGAD